MENDQVSELEGTVAALERQIKLLLDATARQNQHATANPPILPPVVHDAPHASEHAQRKTRRPKPATPPEFDGERAKGLTFLHSCQTYICLCPEEFRDDQTK